jgi:glycosyltransferase involved in cell wall biosynthesis
MKNILLLTNEYPNPDPDYDTPVVHYFTKEWCKIGYKVKVIHYRSVFPIIYYWIANLFTKQIKRFFETDVLPTKRRNKDYTFYKDGVLVYSFPIFKFLPHGRYKKKTINKHLEKILALNNKDNFVPDIIIGHFYNPEIEIITKLKQYYPKAQTCIVLHENPEILKKTYIKEYLALLNDINVWGFRSKALKEKFEMLYGKNYDTFICSSGVPQEYISLYQADKRFENKVKKFCYVGMFIPRKRVSDIITALHKAFPLKDFELDIVGEGMERENLFLLTQRLELQSNVKFHGNLQRDELQTIMDNADCFIMVSESEAFGLVYLEAMAKGCITIGTRGEGIDGVIQHGLNGFLCEARNSDQLSEIIVNINSLSQEKLTEISKMAIETAQEMTDSKVADRYLKNVLSN